MRLRAEAAGNSQLEARISETKNFVKTKRVKNHEILKTWEDRENDGVDFHDFRFYISTIQSAQIQDYF